MIDETKLIDEVNDLMDANLLFYDDASKSRQETLDEIVDLIDEQPKVGEWIPVEERLPKHYGNYLITAINDYEGIYMTVSNYDSQYKSFSSDGVEDDNAIAWMDLPKMYEVRENERP